MGWQGHEKPVSRSAMNPKHFNFQTLRFREIRITKLQELQNSLSIGDQGRRTHYREKSRKTQWEVVKLLWRFAWCDVEIEIDAVAEGGFLAAMHGFEGDVVIVSGTSIAEIGEQLFVAIDQGPGIGRMTKLNELTVGGLVGIVGTAEWEMYQIISSRRIICD